MTGYQSKKDMAQDKLAQPEQEQDATMQSLKDLWRSVCDGVGKAAFAQPAQEPVAFSAEIVADVNGTLSTQWADWWIPNEGDKLYTAPLQRTWVGLTDDQIKEIVGPWGDTPIKGYTRELIDKIEAKLREKNNAN